LRDSDRLREVLGIIDVDGLSRDQGWRADLRLLARETRRRAWGLHGPAATELDRAVAQLDRQIPALTDAQIVIGMNGLLRKLDDGHAFVAAVQSKELSRAAPVNMFQFPEGIYVTAADRRYQHLLGARVEQVGGHPVAEVMTALDPLVCRDNDQQAAAILPLMLCVTPYLHALGLLADPGALAMTVTMPDGTEARESLDAEHVPWDAPIFPHPAGWISLPEILPAPPPLHLRNMGTPYWLSWLAEPGLVYLQFNSVREHPAETFAAFCQRAFDFIGSRPARGLVVDLRWNGGGDTFIAQSLLHQLIGCRKVNRHGALFVIIGRFTFSAAQNTATAIERETRAIFVGEPTGSRPNFVGESVPFTLPYSRVLANVSDLYWQTSWPTDDRPWIAPDIYAPPTFEAYRANRDPAMEAILACGDHLPGW